MENVSSQKNPAAKSEVKSKPNKFLTILKKVFNPKAMAIWIPIAVIAAVFLVVSYYLLFPSKGYFHSDCTDTLVWAAASFESGKLFDPDCSYACLLPFGGSLLMLPFYGIFGFSMTTHLIGMYLFMIAFSVSLLFMLKQMKWKLPWIAIMYSAVMLTVSISVKLREIFWGHVIYYSLGVLFIFVGLLIYFKVCNVYEKNRIEKSPHSTRNMIILLAVMFVWFFLCATNKLMTITIFSLPVIGAIFLERFLDFNQKIKDNKFYGIVLAVTLVSTVAGYIASTIAAGDIIGGYASAYSNFSEPSSWLENFQKFPFAWLTLLGVEIKSGEPIMSLNGVLNLIKIVASLLLVILPVIAACFYGKIKDKSVRILIIVHFLVTALVMMGYVFGMLSAANWRLSPIVCTSVMATVGFGKWVYENKKTVRLGGLLVIPQLCVCAIALVTICLMPRDYGQDEGLNAVSDFLMENDLDFGYATFWNANSITAITNDKVKVRNINDLGDGTAPIGMNLYQSRRQWYTPEPEQEKFFLLLTYWEHSTLIEGNNEVLNIEHETLEFNEFKILVFDTPLIAPTA